MNNNILKLNGYYVGLHSCCIFSLYRIIQYIQTNDKIPEVLFDSMFSVYKSNKEDNIYPRLFEFNPTVDIDISSVKKISYPSLNPNRRLRRVPFRDLAPLINRWFIPTKEIFDIKDRLIKKYNIPTQATMCLRYRGLDKRKESRVTDPSIIINKALEIYETNDAINTILIQTDDSFFLDGAVKRLPNAVVIGENATSYDKTKGIHYSREVSNREEDVKNWLATVLIMSECYGIITTVSNTTEWIIHYRKSFDNFLQFDGNEITDNTY